MRNEPNTTATRQPLKPAQIVDERLRKTSFLTGAMRRPELGGLAGLVVVIIFFFFTANSSMFMLSGMMTILAPASQLGILAIAAALLMIGGEFDLSIGSMIAFTGLAFAAFLVNAHWPLSLSIVATLAFAAFSARSSDSSSSRRGFRPSLSPWRSCSSCAG